MPFTQNQSTTFVYQPQSIFCQLTPALGTSLIAIYQGGPNASKIVGAILAAQNDSVSHDVHFGINIGGTAILGGPITGGSQVTFNTITVAINAGMVGATPPANLMPATMPVDSDGQPYFFLPATAWLFVALTAALATGTVFNVFVPAIGDF